MIQWNNYYKFDFQYLTHYLGGRVPFLFPYVLKLNNILTDNSFNLMKQYELISEDIKSISHSNQIDTVYAINRILISKYQINFQKCYNQSTDFNLQTLFSKGYSHPTLFLLFYSHLLNLKGIYVSFFSTNRYRFLKISLSEKAYYLDFSLPTPIVNSIDFINKLDKTTQLKSISEIELFESYLMGLVNNVSNNLQFLVTMTSLVKLSPYNVNYLILLTEAFIKNNHILDARKYLERIKTLSPQNKFKSQIFYFETLISKKNPSFTLH